MFIASGSCRAGHRSGRAPPAPTCGARRAAHPPPLRYPLDTRTCRRLHLVACTDSPQQAVQVLGAAVSGDRRAFVAVGTDTEAVFVPVRLASGYERALYRCLEAEAAGSPKASVTATLAIATCLTTERTLVDTLPFADAFERQRLVSVALAQPVANLLEFLRHFLSLADAAVLECCLREQAALYPRMALQGAVRGLRQRREVASGTATLFEAPCSAIEAVGIARATGASLSMQKSVWERCALPAERGLDGRLRVPTALSATAADPTDALVFPDDTSALVQVSAMQLESLRDEQLRALLAREGVPTRTDTPREQLVEMTLPYMDEVERREYLIARALQAGEYAEADRLVAGRSRRGQLAARMREALRRGHWPEALALQRELDVLRQQRADITLDEGAYDPYLDQDPWYRPL